MKRPIYETDQSREAESRIAETFAAFKSLRLVKLKFAYAVDYMLMGDTPKAFMEVKERNYDMDTLDRWGGFMLSLHKWSFGNLYAKDAGIHFVSPCGTTGEAPTLSHDEKLRIVEIVVDEVAGRVPVLAGAGGYDTREVIALAREFEARGVSGLLSVTPYYNKPTQEGLYQHFKAINDAIGIPIIMYNIPARSIVDINVDTMKRLYELKNIAGVKDATANMTRVSQQRAAMGEDFNQLSGEDITALGFNAHGGHGCISVTSNIAPRLCSEFQAACQRGDYATAVKLQDKLAPLHQNLFIETSPAPIK